MRLRAGLPILWRGATQVQVGTDPRWAVVLADLSPAACRAMCTVPPGADLRTVRSVLRQARVRTAEATAVLEHLRTARLVVDAPPYSDTADGAAWSALSEHGDGSAVLTHRSRSVVRIEGLGRVGAATAQLVAAAGIGTVVLHDRRPVGPADVGLGGIGLRDVGAPRVAAVARALHDAAPTVRTRVASPESHPAQTTGDPLPAPDLTVLVEPHVADPARYTRLVETGQPHLSVVVREASVLVGPLVRPGATVCLRCLDLHRAEQDPRWPTVATQLATTGVRVTGDGRPRRRVAEPGGAETTSASVAAGLAAAAVLAHVDGRPTGLDTATLEVSLPTATPRRRSWAPHPDCGCSLPGLAG